jgi:hypothetical protein
MLDAPAPLARRTFRDEALEQAFRRDGVVATPLLGADEVVALRAAFSQLRADDGFAPAPVRGPTYHCSFLDSNRAYRRRTFELLVAAMAPHVERLLADFTILQCNFYVKPPGRGDFGLHQNWPALASLDDVTVTLWCPLVDVSAQNGAVGVVPGSHKILPHVQGPATRSYFAGLEQAIIDEGLVRTMALKAGEAAIFDDGIIHGSPPNLSDTARVAAQLICGPADAVPVFFRDAGDDLFEIVEADPEFWLNHDSKDLLGRPPHWRSLGWVRSRNRRIETLAELKALLRRGDEIRRHGIALEPAAPPPGPGPKPGAARPHEDGDAIGSAASTRRWWSRGRSNS